MVGKILTTIAIVQLTEPVSTLLDKRLRENENS